MKSYDFEYLEMYLHMKALYEIHGFTEEATPWYMYISSEVNPTDINR